MPHSDACASPATTAKFTNRNIPPVLETIQKNNKNGKTKNNETKNLKKEHLKNFEPANAAAPMLIQLKSYSEAVKHFFLFCFLFNSSSLCFVSLKEIVFA